MAGYLGHKPERIVRVDEWATDNRWSWADYNISPAPDTHRAAEGGRTARNGGFLEGLYSGSGPPNRNLTQEYALNHTQILSNPPRISPISYANLDYSYGNALINWARDVLQIELMPWQQFLLREGCVRRNGRFRYRTVLAVVARQNGKSLLAAIRILGGLVIFGERFAVGTAHNRWTALDIWMQALAIAQDAGLNISRLRRSTGSEEFYVEGGRYRVATGSTGGARGLSGVDLVVLDELRQMVQWEGYAALDKTRRVRADSQVWAITTEGDFNSIVLNRLQQQARDALEAKQEHPVGYFEWSAEPGLAASDVRGWYQANPALGYTLAEETVRAEFQTDPPGVFEVEVLCRKVAQVASWVDPGEYDACKSPERFPIDGPFVLALDAGPELRHVSIVAGALQEGFHHLELVETFTGPRALAYAETRLAGLLERWRPQACVTLAKSPMEPSTARIAAAHKVDHLVVRPADWAKACRAFYAAVRQRQIRHPGGDSITAALAVTKRGPDGLVTQVHRINEDSDNDAAIAAVLALWAPTQVQATRYPDWTVF